MNSSIPYMDYRWGDYFSAPMRHHPVEAREPIDNRVQKVSLPEIIPDKDKD